MDFAFKGLKNIAAEASTALNRAKQYTEERLGHSERTELDGYFENLLSRAEQIKSWTEKIVASAEAVLEPNLSNRVEDYLTEKLAVTDKRKERLRNLEWLGSNMVAAGQELTPGDCYGSALIKCGQAQLRVGQMEREYAAKADLDFVRPLKKFLDEDAKALARERRILEGKRLDLDASKNKFKKIRSTDQPLASNLPFDQIVKELDESEAEVRRLQDEFDKQVVIVTEICNRIIASNEHHVKCLSKFAEDQAEFYAQASKHLSGVLSNSNVDDKGGPASSSASAPTAPPNSAAGFSTLADLSAS